MSSHHIVRDNQEPALLVLDLTDFPLTQLDLLLEWSPVVMAVGSVCTKLHNLGKKMDLMVFAADEMPSNLTLISNQQPVDMLTYSTDVLEKVMQWLEERNQYYLHVIVGNACSIDQLAYFLPFCDRFHINLFTAKERYLLHLPEKYEKWMRQGAWLKIKQLTADPTFQVIGEVSTTVTTDEYILLTALHDGILTVMGSSKSMIIIEPLAVDDYL